MANSAIAGDLAVVVIQACGIKKQLSSGRMYNAATVVNQFVSSDTECMIIGRYGAICIIKRSLSSE